MLLDSIDSIDSIDSNRLLPHGEPGAADAGEQDKAARCALSLCGHSAPSNCIIRQTRIYWNSKGTSCFAGDEGAMFFTFPEDARWNDERGAVEFGVAIGEYTGVVRVPRRVFQHLLAERPIPEKCVEGYHLHRTQLERIAERKLRRRQLTEDGNVEITSRDLRERDRSMGEGAARRRGAIGAV